MKKLTQTASVIVILGGLGLFLSSSSCGSDSPSTIVDNAAGAAGSGGSAGSTGGDSGGATSTGGASGSSALTDASAGSAGSDLDATIFVDSMLPIPDGAFTLGDSSIDDDAGDPVVIDDDAGPVVSKDGGLTIVLQSVLCGTLDGGANRGCRVPGHCCYDSDTASGVCGSSLTKCAPAAGTFLCDGPSDCGAGEVCCATVSTAPKLVTAPNHEYSTRCQTTCGTGLVLKDTAYAIACTKSSDCTGTLQTCRAVANMPKGVGICASRLMVQ